MKGTTMSEQIRNIITSTLHGHGIIPQNYADPIDVLTKALTEAAYDVVDAIVERVEFLELPLSQGEVRTFLDDLGLPSRPQPQVEPEPITPEMQEDSLEGRVARLEYARRSTSGVVRELTNVVILLAERAGVAVSINTQEDVQR
jgi:hypothetical protein